MLKAVQISNENGVNIEDIVATNPNDLHEGKPTPYYRVVYGQEGPSFVAKAYAVIALFGEGYSKEEKEQGFGFHLKEADDCSETTTDYKLASIAFELTFKFDGTTWLDHPDSNEFGDGAEIARFAWLIQHMHKRAGEIIGHPSFQ